MKKQKGITLLALVITIIVLIILAGVTISALLGDDGIVKQAGIAEEDTNVAGEKEQIEMAYNAVYMNNKRNKLGDVTAGQLEQQLKDNGADVLDGDFVTETTDSNGNKIFTVEFNSGRKYSIDVVNKEVEYIGGGSEAGGTVIPEGTYSVSEEVTLAPQELFNVAVLDSTAKTAKIEGMNTTYITKDSDDNFYHINDSSISDTLVVPYEVTIDNEIYTVTEVNLDCENTIDRETIIAENNWHESVILESAMPDVKRVIYPNTVTKIGTDISADAGTNVSIAFWTGSHVLEEVILSDNLMEICEYVFSNCTNLKSVTLPSSITSIGSHAFYSCSSLTNITIPSSVTSIETNAFACCSSLTSITIPSSVTSIGNSAFTLCSSLTSITIPDSVTSIGGSAFSYCTGLTSITIPSSVTSIGSRAFQGCSNLTSITIPDSVTSIEEFTFYNCTSLATVNYTGTQEQWNAITIDSYNTPLRNATKVYNYVP